MMSATESRAGWTGCAASGAALGPEGHAGPCVDRESASNQYNKPVGGGGRGEAATAQILPKVPNKATTPTQN